MTGQTANRGRAAAKTHVPEGDSTPPGWPGVSRLPAWLHATQTSFRTAYRVAACQYDATGASTKLISLFFSLFQIQTSACSTTVAASMFVSTLWGAMNVAVRKGSF